METIFYILKKIPILIAQIELYILFFESQSLYYIMFHKQLTLPAFTVSCPVFLTMRVILHIQFLDCLHLPITYLHPLILPLDSRLSNLKR